MGYPLLLSPTDQSTDSLMLGITSLNATPEADLDSMLIDYKLERLPWLADAKGKLIKFEKPAIFEPGPGVSGTVFGISYKISGQLFSEKSYYLRCKEHSFSLKYLISSEEEKYIPTIEKIIGSFTCL
ncbi:MAG: hypothetical protein A2451_06290 [Bdellovibrionales bacterium RIFOXYC2_FULL_39_8]|nr:MAG: hypothetical protein A2451_06290 [Bdellovibrionales bacterium RIFOXYC2_FULL_39_8]